MQGVYLGAGWIAKGPAEGNFGEEPDVELSGVRF